VTTSILRLALVSGLGLAALLVSEGQNLGALVTRARVARCWGQATGVRS
jgi:hypothetical protein